MDTVATRIHETGLQLARHRDAFFARTRQAGEAFLGETRDAGRQLANALQLEARRLRKYAAQRTAQLRTDAQEAMRIQSVERALLSQVDGTLRAVDARVRARLAELEASGKPARKAVSKAVSKVEARKSAGATRARKAKPSLPAIAA